MANATDIITYIGIPLAVLGVLPILYTFGIAIINLRRVRTALIHHGHKPRTSTKQQDGFTLRSSPMTTLIEVELPKFAIAPLERNHDDYWQLTQKTQSHEKESDHLLRAESTLSTIEEGKVQGYLRGGSWRAFHWKKLTVGKKLYRIQYEDELREPPAEVDFTDLVNFLLDWGAQLDGMGWEKLRSAGLWTPAGTVLLKLPHEDETKNYQHDWILRTVMPDESDGVLTVCMQWPSIFSEIGASRGAHSLPPGWGRLEQPRVEHEKDLATRIEGLRQLNKQAIDSMSMRLKTEGGLISQVYWEKDRIETRYGTLLTHLSKLPMSQSWFTTAVSSLLHGTLWGFELPTDISTFARKDTIPVGVMVLLKLLPEDKAPQWTTNTSQPSVNSADLHRRRFEATRAAERLEASMPPQQAQIARSNREQNERQQRMDDLMEMTRARSELERRRFMDAIASVRIGNKAVADTCRDYLVQIEDIGKGWTVRDVAEAVLYLLVLDQGEDETSEGFKILKVLDDWMTWTNAGGILREQFSWLESNKTAFCYAACLVAVVQQGVLSTKGKGKAGVDMLECLKMWRKVRLG